MFSCAQNNSGNTSTPRVETRSGSRKNNEVDLLSDVYSCVQFVKNLWYEIHAIFVCVLHIRRVSHGRGASITHGTSITREGGT